jgi:two-component system chemotaxis response regulator CheB
MEKSGVTRLIETVVIGGSAGSLEVLFKLLPLLKASLSVSILIVLHRRSSGDSSLSELLNSKTVLPLREAEDKDVILPGHIYLAPSDYHLLVEKNHTLSLDYSEKVNYSRPSLDVTMEAVADVFGPAAAGIILSGANEDGTMGLQFIKDAGGIAIAQDPQTALIAVMPQNAIDHMPVDHVLNTAQMATFINELNQPEHNSAISTYDG